MKIAWDMDKARVNVRKHGLHFREVEPVFFDPNAIVTEDIGSIDEQRHVVIGMGALSRLVTVVYCYRRGNIRVISARKSTAGERKTYEERI
jgi:uncharacterized DUF497 family protein